MRCLKTTLNIIDSLHPPQRTLISVRLKRLNSIRRKLKRQETQFTLGQMDDIIGVRVICPNLADVLSMNQRIQARSGAYKVKNYTTCPRETGYRATHHIMRFQQPLTPDKKIGVRFEIQVRSFFQHRWAVQSEAYGEEVKAGHAPEHIKDELRELSEQIRCWEEANPDKTQADMPSYTNVVQGIPEPGR